MGFEFILGLLVPLTVVAVVGHLIWIGVRGLVRGLASLFGDPARAAGDGGAVPAMQ